MSGKRWVQRRELRVHLQNQVQGWKKKLIKLKGKMKVHKPKSDAFTHQNLNLEILWYEGCEGQKNVSMGSPIGRLFWDMDIDWFRLSNPYSETMPWNGGQDKKDVKPNLMWILFWNSFKTKLNEKFTPHNQILKDM